MLNPCFHGYIAAVSKVNNRRGRGSQDINIPNLQYRVKVVG
ncbi:hypothetical protein SAMD00020551_3946 [Mesobacillus selenatarsenatis SF-1]|uniref:Uncharacterized protein n=1 Tax=Mesobacillus selenatarsenatis (strain DSM 18680 / JCM 14380 / FERM P-15431 / SF-1) TaxID=1321606 RepID=A0A0A8X787_MESS1|nr:hypothetical protein SAMD00020551_3946 [Mesobacillus selenatarsenatis SF-1]